MRNKFAEKVKQSLYAARRDAPAALQLHGDGPAGSTGGDNIARLLAAAAAGADLDLLGLSPDPKKRTRQSSGESACRQIALYFPLWQPDC